MLVVHWRHAGHMKSSHAWTVTGASGSPIVVPTSHSAGISGVSSATDEARLLKASAKTTTSTTAAETPTIQMPMLLPSALRRALVERIPDTELFVIKCYSS